MYFRNFLLLLFVTLPSCRGYYQNSLDPNTSERQTLLFLSSAYFTSKSNPFSSLKGIAIDASKNLYVCDLHRIRKVSPSGFVTTLAGSTTSGFVDGTGTEARFSSPGGLVLDSSGNVYVSDTENHSIRKITPSGSVTTLAGNGVGGSGNGTGTAAYFQNPLGIAINASSELFVADTGNYLIRKVTQEGTVSTYSGSGVSSYTDGTLTGGSFSNPGSISFDGSSSFYITDGNKIRKIDSSNLSTVAGDGNSAYLNGSNLSSSFSSPQSIAYFNSVLYVSDTGNLRIRSVQSDGTVSLFSGSGDSGTVDGSPSLSRYSYPFGIVSDGSGSFYLTDSTYIRILGSDGSVRTLQAVSAE
ncbi:MAG: hypothetical protein KDK54_22060 [Leptospiraceae bacterium]|nr:hypothetical protein [Leptospiraceae bacterium]